MITINKKHLLIMIFVFMLPLISSAAVPAWQIIPAESSLNFTAIQNGAPVTGKFTKFSGEINVDPNQLDASSVKIVVDVGSISDPYNQLADTLKTADWFNIGLYPQAIFKSTHFIKTGDKTYQANGTLTIRDKTLPITLNFTQEDSTQDKVRIKGSTVIKRTSFGVGQGEWADTNAIKDEVHIDFVITAIKKPA